MTTRMLVQGIVTILYTIECAGLLVTALPRYKERFYVPMKMACSVSFVLAATVFAFVSEHMRYFYFLLVPLLLCVAGDFFMGKYQVKKRRQSMMLGILFFLMAHMGFVLCFFQIDATFDWWNIFLPLVVLAGFLFSRRLFRLHLGRFFVPAAIYAVFLALMLSKAVQIAFLQPSLAACWVAVGAVAFFISDATIVFLYFYKFKKPEHRLLIHYVNLATYYFGILAIAISILYYAGM